MNKNQIGWIGQTYVMFKLAEEGLFSLDLPPEMDFDLITSLNEKIEIKTSTIHIEKRNYILKNKNKNVKKTNPCTREYWAFGNNGTFNKKRDRKCDFFIFVCLDRKYKVKKTFIVPKKIIGERRIISIPKEFKQKSYNAFSLKEYENKWDLIKTKEIHTSL